MGTHTLRSTLAGEIAPLHGDAVAASRSVVRAGGFGRSEPGALVAPSRSLALRLVLALVLIASVLASAAGAQRERAPLPKVPVRLAPLGAGAVADSWATDELRLVVKFVDSARARATVDSSLASLAGEDLSPALGLVIPHRLRFSPLIALPPERLTDLEQRAARRSGRAQPDLAGIVAVQAGDGSVAALRAAGQALAALELVEFAHLQRLGTPPPGDIPPTTPDLVPDQTYRGPAPGTHTDKLHGHGVDGAGVRLFDCEYAWRASHEDLVDVDLHLEPGQTPDPETDALGFAEHGTAVLGMLASAENAYGCSGMVPGAELHTHPEWTVEGGFRRVECITSAVAAAAPGDVVLLEMQAVGPGFSYGPAELDPAVWLVTRVASDAGVVVVGAAGNGNQNLDHWLYADYMAMGDSGAILVGAGTNDPTHKKLDYSTFGARVDVHGWGHGVTTLGYGPPEYGGDVNQRYTHGFAGTSSAAPFAAAAACLLQSHAKVLRGEPLPPEELRALLVTTGIPQGAGDPIGPMVDTGSAFDAIPWLDVGGGLGPPRLHGWGPFVGGSLYGLDLTDALPGAVATLVIGLSQLDAPFKGGTLVPNPDLLISLPASAQGGITLLEPVPGGLPSGQRVALQWWVADPAGPHGFHASNGVRLVVP
jgi:hypothetical protein